MEEGENGELCVGISWWCDLNGALALIVALDVKARQLPVQGDLVLALEVPARGW